MWDKYKATPKEQQSAKLRNFLVIVLIGVILVGAGQHYLPNTNYAKSLYKSWQAIENPAQLDPTKYRTKNVPNDTYWGDTFETNKEELQSPD